MATTLDISRIKEGMLGETAFCEEHNKKYESILCQGNGYLGVRNATEEYYFHQQRNCFLAGLFNQADDTEVSELPNIADVLACEIVLNGHRFHLLHGTILSYSRYLNIYTGEHVREIEWRAPTKECIKLCFKRFVSMDALHLMAQKIEVTPIEQDVHVKLSTGIDGTVTNSGAQHFYEGDKRLFNNEVLQYTQTTTKSNVAVVVCSALQLTLQGEPAKKGMPHIGRRSISLDHEELVPKAQVYAMEKITAIHTQRDQENTHLDVKALEEKTRANALQGKNIGYDTLLQQHIEAIKSKIWSQSPIQIVSQNAMDQFAMHYAQFQMYAMTPKHDDRMNIGAKGLSGEAYKGHTFWDTEVFLLPYFIFTDPEVAKKLMVYRYHGLQGARAKARHNGYQGAQFPWESGWVEDGELTPEWGEVDIVTGTPTKVWSGFIEHHVTADVAYGTWLYYSITQDKAFMEEYGYEIILDTAIFWSSRVTLGQDGKYHINDVLGPDEYTEHVDDNAYTNYMAHWNLSLALHYAEELEQENPALYECIAQKTGFSQHRAQCDTVCKNLYVPKAREDGIIAQNAQYLGLKNIDLTKYKNQEKVGSIFKDYNMDQVSEMQVSKQADLLLLFVLLEELFDHETKVANWNYYEPRTLHDSSLSLSTHCILANDMKHDELAYRLFCDAVNIDIGDNMKSSDEGIHAANLGGIWQCVVFAFGGVRLVNGTVRIAPRLPKTWDSLSFVLHVHGATLHIAQTHDEIRITNTTKNHPITLNVMGEVVEITSEHIFEVAAQQ